MSRFSWEAIYEDGQMVQQKEEDGTVHSYEELNRQGLIEFRLVEGRRILFALGLDPGQRLIWRRRVFNAQGGSQIIYHLVGWQMTTGNQNVQSIAYIPEDDYRPILMAGKFQEEHPLFYSVQLRPCEVQSDGIQDPQL
jgi:hypothetical protein